MQDDTDNIEAEYSEAVLNALNSGRKITAIKILREEQGIDLKEAKEAIDRLERRRRGDAANHPVMQEQGGGKLVLRLVIAIIVLVLIYRFFLQT